MKFIQENFNAGEWSPLLEGRVQLQRYSSACRRLSNFIPTPYGPARKRQGLEYLGSQKYSNKAVRLEPFRFTNEVTYLLEFGDLYVRFWRDGAYLAGSEILTPYTEAQLSSLRFDVINDVIYVSHVAHKTRELSRDTDTSWSLSEFEPMDEPYMETNATDTTVAASATTGAITLIASTGIFDSTIVGSKLKIGHVQGAQVFSETLATTNAKATRRPWVAASGVFTAGEILYVITGNNLQPLFTVLADYTGGVDYVPGNDDPEDYPAHFERGIVSIEPVDVFGAWTMETEGTWSGEWWIQESTDGGTTWITRYQMATDRAENFLREGDESDNPLKIRVVAVTGAPQNSLMTLTLREVTREGVARVTGYSNSILVSATVEKELFSTDATKLWSENEWNPRRGFPSQVKLHESRLILAGTLAKPQTVWGSRVDDFEDFGGGGTDADDPFSVTIFTGNQNPIRWLSAQRVLLIGLGDSVRALIGEAEKTLQPGRIRAPRQAGKGSADLQPVEADDFTLYPQAGSRILRGLQNDYERGVYSASDLTIEAEHLTSGGIRQIAFRQNRESIVYVVTGSGRLACMVMEPNQAVKGWFTIETQGTVESVAVLPTDGEEDEVYVAVAREINGEAMRYIERFKVGQYRVQDDAEKSSLFFVDSGISYTGPETETITGLDHLEGEKVQILADGAVHPPRVVTGGEVTLAYGVASAIIGLPYTAILQPNKLEAVGSNGTAQGSEVSIQEIVVDFYKTLNCQFSESPTSKRQPIPFREFEMAMGDSPPLYTGYQSIRTDFGSSFDGSIALIHESPTCCTIRSLITRWKTKGR